MRQRKGNTTHPNCKHGLLERCRLCTGPVTLESAQTFFRQLERQYISIEEKQVAELEYAQIKTCPVKIRREILLHFLQAQVTKRRSVIAGKPMEAVSGDVFRPWLEAHSSRAYQEWARNPRKNEIRAAGDMAFAKHLKQARKAGIEPDPDMFLADQLMAEFGAFVKVRQLLQLTSEQLESKFALGDGRVKTWGAANSKEHLIAMRKDLAESKGGVANAKLHQEALRLMKEYRVSTLFEVRAKQAKGPRLVAEGVF